MARRRCGTVTGYQAHVKRGERPCEACKARWRDYHRAYRAGRDLSAFRVRRRNIRAAQQRMSDRVMSVRSEAELEQVVADYRRMALQRK